LPTQRRATPTQRRATPSRTPMIANDAHGHASLAPSPWIERYAHLVGAGASVLDLAAGSGRHARLFAARGARVLAVDRDAAALATLGGIAGIRTLNADLEGAP